MSAPAGFVTFLFTDIEGSSRLWEMEPERMRPALARHDALVRGVVDRHAGRVVKMLGDGVHAAFDDPAAAIDASVELLLAMSEPVETALALRLRCGLHGGVVEERDGDFFGSAVNRAARIMSVAHGGQLLLSQVVVDAVAKRLPRGVALRDLGAVRLRDLARPEHVFQLLHPKLRQDFPALRSLESTPNNLPQQVTALIGRDRELAEIKRLLGTTRLLTLLGIGGIGKTRIALHAGAEVLQHYPDGVWFVDFAPQPDASLVPQTIASVLNVKEEPGRSVGDALVEYMRDKRLLLILDNCEHLLHACADIASQLLRAGSGLRILATSREPLRIAGETSYPMPALAVPDARLDVTRDALDHYEATRLFVQRARASLPQLALSDDDARAIADICRQLDGLPLAIELAAARIRSLPVQAIAARLSDRFRLLAGGDRTALPRQQTLRALIDWSHDLLTEAERLLFRRLAVFSGGWTLEQIDAVCSGGDLDQADVLELLSHLVDKSLVVRDETGSRYRLLETIRQYATERLEQSGENELARARHLACYLDLAERARASLSGPEQAHWLALLDAERENLLTAYASALRLRDGGEPGLRLAYALGPYWFVRGQPALTLRLSREALAHPGAQVASVARERLLFNAGQQCCFTGRYDEAQPMLEESLAIARGLGDSLHAARVLQPLGMAAFGRGDRPAAKAYMEEAVRLARAAGDKRELAAALNGLAQLHRVDGDLDAAEPLYDQVISLARDVGDAESVAIGLLNLAMVSIGRGRGAAARDMLVEVLAIAAKTGSKPVGQSALDVIAGFATWRHDFTRAARLYGAAQSQIAATGLQRDPADEAFLMPHIERARAAIGDVAFTAAQLDGSGLDYDAAVEEASRSLEPP